MDDDYEDDYIKEKELNAHSKSFINGGYGNNI